MKASDDAATIRAEHLAGAKYVWHIAWHRPAFVTCCCRNEGRGRVYTKFLDLGAQKGPRGHLLCYTFSNARPNKGTRGLKLRGGPEHPRNTWGGFASGLHLTRSAPWMWTLPTRLQHIEELVRREEWDEVSELLNGRCIFCRTPTHQRHHCIAGKWCAEMQVRTAEELDRFFAITDKVQARMRCGDADCRLCGRRIVHCAPADLAAVEEPRPLNIGLDEPDCDRSDALVDVPSELLPSFVVGLSRFHHMWALLCNVHRTLLFVIPFVHEDATQHTGMQRLSVPRHQNALSAAAGDSLYAQCLAVHQLCVALWAARNYPRFVRVALHFKIPLIDVPFIMPAPASILEIIRSPSDAMLVLNLIRSNGFKVSTAAVFSTTLAQIVEHAAARAGRQAEAQPVVRCCRHFGTACVAETNSLRRALGTLPAHFGVHHVEFLTISSSVVLAGLAQLTLQLDSTELMARIHQLTTEQFRAVEACLLWLLMRSIGPQRRSVFSNLRFEQFKIHPGTTNIRLLIRNHQASIDKVTRRAVCFGRRELPLHHSELLHVLYVLATSRNRGDALPRFVFSRSQTTADEAAARPDRAREGVRYVGFGYSTFNNYFRELTSVLGVDDAPAREVHCKSIRQLIVLAYRAYNMPPSLHPQLAHILGHSPLTERQYYGVPSSAGMAAMIEASTEQPFTERPAVGSATLALHLAFAAYNGTDELPPWATGHSDQYLLGCSDNSRLPAPMQRALHELLTSFMSADEVQSLHEGIAARTLSTSRLRDPCLEWLRKYDDTIDTDEPDHADDDTDDE